MNAGGTLARPRASLADFRSTATELVGALEQAVALDDMVVETLDKTVALDAIYDRLAVLGWLDPEPFRHAAVVSYAAEGIADGYKNCTFDPEASLERARDFEALLGFVADANAVPRTESGTLAA